jgi:hypothetical protein
LYIGTLSPHMTPPQFNTKLMRGSARASANGALVHREATISQFNHQSYN